MYFLLHPNSYRQIYRQKRWIWLAKDFVWPRLCYTVEQHDGESVDDACKRLDIPTEIIGPNGQRIETLIICLAP